MNENYENKISSDGNEKTKNEQNDINNIEKSELLDNDLNKNEAKMLNYQSDINNNNNLIQHEKINYIRNTDNDYENKISSDDYEKTKNEKNNINNIEKKNYRIMI